jgi:hypothetical protein
VGRRIPLQVPFASLSPLALAAQFLHAGAYDREIVGSTGSGHVFSSHPIGKLRLYRPLIAGETYRSRVNFRGQAVAVTPGLKAQIAGIGASRSAQRSLTRGRHGRR